MMVLVVSLSNLSRQPNGYIEGLTASQPALEVD